MLDFTDRTIFITGAASGIGRETAILLDSLGANLVLVDLNEEGLASLRPELRQSPIAFTADITDYGKVEEIFNTVTKKYQLKLAGLVHSAGVSATVPLRAISLEDYQRVQRINTEAGLFLAKFFAKAGVYDTAIRPAIVYLASVYALVGSKANVAYAVSKAGLIGMTKALAVELAPKEIRVNAILPGFIETPMLSKQANLFDNAHLEELRKLHPLGLGEAKDIASSIAFLLSGAAKWITGTVLTVDGGYTAQ